MRKQLLAPLAVMAAVVCVSGAWAANSVVVESRVMATNAVDCPIHVFLENDIAVNSVLVPLVIREVTPGSYISAIKLSWNERIYVGGPIGDILFSNLYAEPNGTCRPGGFGSPEASSDTLKHPVVASPECALFAAVKLMAPPLAPGTDVTGSLLLTVDVTGPPGTFEIDTTCVDPQNHLTYQNEFGQFVIPSFTKGVITTVANAAPTAICQNVTVTTGPGCVADASIDNGSFDADGDPITITQDPPAPYPLGQTIVQLTVADDNCTSNSCSAVVTVEDGTPPIVTCPYDTVIIVDAIEGGAFVEFEATATDECTSVSVVSTPPSGSFFPIGVSTVSSIATDGAGNADTCAFFVAVGSTGYCNDQPEDVDCSGFIDAIDLGQLIDVLFVGRPPSGPCCTAKK